MENHSKDNQSTDTKTVEEVKTSEDAGKTRKPRKKKTLTEVSKNSETLVKTMRDYVRDKDELEKLIASKEKIESRIKELEEKMVALKDKIIQNMSQS